MQLRWTSYHESLANYSHPARPSRAFSLKIWKSVIGIFQWEGGTSENGGSNSLRKQAIRKTRDFWMFSNNVVSFAAERFLRRARYNLPARQVDADANRRLRWALCWKATDLVVPFDSKMNISWPHLWSYASLNWNRNLGGAGGGGGLHGTLQKNMKTLIF